MPCFQIPAANKITSLICAKDPISGLRAILTVDRQDFHKPALNIRKTYTNAYNHLPAKSSEASIWTHVSKMSQGISTSLEGIVLFIVT